MSVRIPVHDPLPSSDPVPTDARVHVIREATDPPLVRPVVYQHRRRRWPALLAATLVGGVAAAIYVSSQYEARSLGTRLDDTVAAAESKVDRSVSDLRGAASGAAAGTAIVADRVAAALNDTGITAAVKTALAADPTLSALKIEVKTHEGVVQLDGPAPDEKARQRAAVLAAAPEGVRQVENRLVVAAANPSTVQRPLP